VDSSKEVEEYTQDESSALPSSLDADDSVTVTSLPLERPNKPFRLLLYLLLEDFRFSFLTTIGGGAPEDRDLNELTSITVSCKNKLRFNFFAYV
jgi:hypothetical protein